MFVGVDMVIDCWFWLHFGLFVLLFASCLCGCFWCFAASVLCGLVFVWLLLCFDWLCALCGLLVRFGVVT